MRSGPAAHDKRKHWQRLPPVRCRKWFSLELPMTHIAGFSIIIHDLPIGRKQIRFPKTKKWRIRKKWAKRPENFKNLFMDQPMMDTINRRIICTSRMAAQLRRAVG
jgi:hypothetical protein